MSPLRVRKKTKRVKKGRKREELQGGVVSVGPLTASVQTGHLAEVFGQYGEVRSVQFIGAHKAEVDF